jgi:hypothetical protein
MNEKMLLAYFAARATKDDMLSHQECDVKVGIEPYYIYNAYPSISYNFDDPSVKIIRIPWSVYCNYTNQYRLVKTDNGLNGGVYSVEELKMKYALNMIWKLREFEKFLDGSFKNL